MPQNQECTWTGVSGKQYRYSIHKRGTTFKALPGNYIFAKRIAANQWQAIYAGETSDLSERFDGHHQKPCIDRHGATHIHVHVNSGGAQARRDEEADIRQRYQPPCNKQ